MEEKREATEGGWEGDRTWFCGKKVYNREAPNSLRGSLVKLVPGAVLIVSMHGTEVGKVWSHPQGNWINNHHREKRKVRKIKGREVPLR